MNEKENSYFISVEMALESLPVATVKEIIVWINTDKLATCTVFITCDVVCDVISSR